MSRDRRAIDRSVLVALFSLIAAGSTVQTARAAEVLAHYEYQCLRDNGCPHSANTAAEASFSIEVYPDRVDFLDFAPGETTDVTVPIDDFLIDFFTSGSLSAPEPIEFLAVMVGAGGSGRVLNKTDFLMGVDSDGPPVRVDAGYDIPLVNGIDLKGAGVPTGMRFQLFDLEMFDSDALPGSTMRAHFRYEVLGNRIPEPASVSMLGLGVGVALVCGRRRVRRNSRHRSPTNEPAATPMP